MTQEYVVSDDTVREFEQDGVTVIRGLVDAATVSRLREAVAQDIENPGPFFHGYESEEGRFHGNLRLWESNPIFGEFCLDSHLPGVAQQFFSSEKINLLYDQLFVKESNMSQRTRWHNDQPYWPIRGWQVLSIWIALDTVNQSNGRVEFIRGSHRWNRWFQPEVFGKTTAISQYERNPEFEDIPDIESSREDYDIVSWDLEPGDVYVFHALTVHGAGGNHSSEVRRRGYTVRYTGDDVTYDPRIGVSKPLLSDQLAAGQALDSQQFPRVFG